MDDNNEQAIRHLASQIQMLRTLLKEVDVEDIKTIRLILVKWLEVATELSERVENTLTR